MAARMGIEHRILDLDSPGGLIEDAMRAGDSIGDSHWTIWVREGAVCHSACVLILAAGDQRLVSGAVGIHRMIRLPRPRPRAKLNAELQQVHAQLVDYLGRNGAASAIADLMMTVPSRDLRLLGAEELHSFGLEGANPVQEDLERLRVLRQCGSDFLRRKSVPARAGHGLRQAGAARRRDPRLRGGVVAEVRLPRPALPGRGADGRVRARGGTGRARPMPAATARFRRQGRGRHRHALSAARVSGRGHADLYLAHAHALPGGSSRSCSSTAPSTRTAPEATSCLPAPPDSTTRPA